MAHADEPLADPARPLGDASVATAYVEDPFARARRPERPAFPVDILGVVFLGGCVGGYARYALSDAWSVSRATFPSAILTANLIGAFVLGLVVILAADLVPSRYLRPLLGTGFCGALTTFSSVVVAAAGIFARHRPGIAVGYLGATVVGGLATAALGLAAGRGLTRWVRGARAGGGDRDA